MRGRLNYGNVVATLALFIALGGTGYAISKLPKDSVKSKQIAANAVKTAEVANGSLTPADFAQGTLGPGVAGPQGPAGADGAQGPPGPTSAAFGDRNDPVASPDFPNYISTNVTTRADGRLLVMFAINPLPGIVDGMSVNCDVGDATGGLYVDGVPVPDTQFDLLDDDPITQIRFGVTTNPVPAGAHMLRVSTDCTTGAPSTGQASSNRSLGAIVLGG